jgi:hypothetical protein
MLHRDLELIVPKIELHAVKRAVFGNVFHVSSLRPAE